MIVTKNVGISITRELATGVKVPNTVKPPMNFLHDSKDYEMSFSNDIKRTMELCDKIYKHEAIIGNAVDILVEFATTKLWAEDTGNEELNKILNFFNNNVNDGLTGQSPGMFALFEKLFTEYLVFGNVFPYAYWQQVQVEGIKKPFSIPTSITLLNPQHIQIPSESVAFGNEVLYFTPDYNTMQVLRSDGRSYPEYMKLKKSLPNNMIRKLKNQRSDKLMLDSRFVSHIKRKGRDYSGWGIPFILRTFTALSIIKKIRKLDESTIEGLMNLLVLFKVGTDEFPASPERVAALASLLSEQKASTQLVWAHDLDVSTHGPDGKVLAFKDKYAEAYTELKRGLGVPPGLLGEPQQVRYEDLLAMTERLNTIRRIGLTWLQHSIYNKIAIQNGFTDIMPNPRMARMNLSNSDSLKTHIMNFYDRGLIDTDTALTEAGYDYDSVVDAKKRTKKNDKLFQPPQLPWAGQDNKQGFKNDNPEKTNKRNSDEE